jgi:hypothetical protein
VQQDPVVPAQLSLLKHLLRFLSKIREKVPVAVAAEHHREIPPLIVRTSREVWR